MKLLSYILSPIFVITFTLILIVFHPFQWLSFNLFGVKGHAKVIDALNFFLVKSMLIIGVTVRVINQYKIPEETSIIFVSNHQSISDIPPIGWFLESITQNLFQKLN